MKTIHFTPLRIIKKTGKVTIASYMQWRKVKAADRQIFTLVLNEDHKDILPNALVHNHKGEVLYWFNHDNPDDLPLPYADIGRFIEILGVDKSAFEGEEWKLSEPLAEGFHWSVMGFDVDGIPTFSHYTQSYVADHFDNMNEFEPLTVRMVLIWYGYFLWKLKHALIKSTI